MFYSFVYHIMRAVTIQLADYLMFILLYFVKLYFIISMLY